MLGEGRIRSRITLVFKFKSSQGKSGAELLFHIHKSLSLSLSISRSLYRSHSSSKSLFPPSPPFRFFPSHPLPASPPFSISPSLRQGDNSLQEMTGFTIRECYPLSHSMLPVAQGQQVCVCVCAREILLSVQLRRDDSKPLLLC